MTATVESQQQKTFKVKQAWRKSITQEADELVPRRSPSVSAPNVPLIRLSVFYVWTWITRGCNEFTPIHRARPSHSGNFRKSFAAERMGWRKQVTLEKLITAKQRVMIGIYFITAMRENDHSRYIDPSTEIKPNFKVFYLSFCSFSAFLKIGKCCTLCSTTYFWFNLNYWLLSRSRNNLWFYIRMT